MGRITEAALQLKAGDMDAAGFAALIADFPWRKVKRNLPSDPEARMAYIDDHLYDDDTDTWGEVTAAYDRGLIPKALYYRLSDARYKAATP